MSISQVRSSSVHAELARVLRVTKQAWNLEHPACFQLSEYRLHQYPSANSARRMDWRAVNLGQRAYAL